MDHNIEDLKFWYYIDKGEVTGPFSEEEMIALYQQHSIEDNTEVWRNGMTDWVELSTTELSKKENFIQQSGENEINPAMAWILTFLPVLFAGAISRKSLPLLVILLMLHCTIGILDSILLMKEGKAKKTAVLWALLLPPVYLVKRAGALNRKKTGAVIWCLFFALELFICAKVYDIPSLLQPQKSEEITEPEEITETGGITLNDFVKAYVKNPNYEMKEEEEGRSLFIISGMMDYEGKEAAIIISFQIEEDGSVHFKEMQVNGDSENAGLYYELMEKLK